MKIFRALFRIFANHCPEPNVRHFLLKVSGVFVGKDAYVNMSFNAVDDYDGALIYIGDRVAVAPNVSIVASSNPNNSKLIKYFEPKKEKVVVKNDVWIGAGVVIMPGITIGECSVLGANAVINKDVEPYSVVVGVPGRKVGDVRDKVNV